MSILIKGHFLPKDREHYLIQINADGTIYDAVGRGIVGVAVELPPHGPLIDLDALNENAAELMDEFYTNGEYAEERGVNTLRHIAIEAPIIIEAEVDE